MEGGVVQKLLENKAMIQAIILGDTPEDQIKNPIHRRLIEKIHKGATGDIPTLRSKEINLVIKHMNEVNGVLKCIPVKNLSDLKYAAIEVHYRSAKRLVSKEIKL